MHTDNYPEQPPEKVPELRTTFDPIAQAKVVADSYDAAFWGNCFEAKALGDGVQRALMDIGKARGSMQDETAKRAAAFIRQVQAQQVFEGLFFEKMNHTYGQVHEFTTRDPLEQLVESETAHCWRTRLATYTQAELAIPGLTRAVQFKVAPAIRTALPMAEDSVQFGYINQQGEYRQRNSAVGVVTAASIKSFSTPLMSTEASDINLLETEEFAEDQTHRDVVARALQKLFKSFTGQNELDAKVTEAITVVPSISNVDALASIDMCLRLESKDYARPAPKAFLVQSFFNGILQQSRMIDGVSGSRILAGPKDEPIAGLIMPQALPRPTPGAFTRPEEDAMLSLIALPVHKHHDASQKLNPLLPVKEYKEQQYGTPAYLQHDPSFPAHIANIAIVASY